MLLQSPIVLVVGVAFNINIVIFLTLLLMHKFYPRYCYYDDRANNNDNVGIAAQLLLQSLKLRFLLLLHAPPLLPTLFPLPVVVVADGC